MEIKDKVKQTFKNSKGEPFILTDGQAELFALIYKKKYSRNHIETHTRYGKSDVISMAVLLRVANYAEKWAIVAGNKDKAGIIMSYAIGHIFDNAYIHKRFQMDPGENEENIRRYRNKSKINFNLAEKRGDTKLGEMFITTAEGALGFGAPNVVEDEAGLISGKDHALVMRMLGDQPENFLVKIGNPWEMEHFRKSYEDPNYHKLTVDFKQGIKEGRLTPAYIDEMRKQPFFDVLYECKFPPSGMLDEKGWVQLLSKDEIDRAMIDHAEGFGINKLGVDVAGGGRNFSVIVQRFTNVAKKIYKTKEPDTISLAEAVINTRTKNKGMRPSDIFTDMVGIGRGMYDILNREMPGVYGLNGGSEPTTVEDKDKFVNLRAELFWKMREWIIGGGKLERDDDWYQLTKIKYRTKLEGRRGKLQIISKEELAHEGIDSPDVADALSMTFRTDDIPQQQTYFDTLDKEEKQYFIDKQEQREWDPMHPFSMD
jgi:hypothetical protein